jgi:transglutaminase/protease-like cytokinesis protein 3
MAEDRSKQKLVIYDKAGTKKAEGEVGANSATLTGIAAGTKVAAGDYKAAFSDGTTESNQVDVPGFEVPAAKVDVTGVTVVETNTVEVGKTVALAPTIVPDNATDKSVTYASSDESVAKVDGSGVVTGVKAGTADITVTTTDGGKTAKSTFTVTDPAAG